MTEHQRHALRFVLAFQGAVLIAASTGALAKGMTTMPGFWAGVAIGALALSAAWCLQPAGRQNGSP